MAQNTYNGSVVDKVGERASGVYAYARRSLDRVIEPASRQKAYDTTADFASARPIIFSFIVSQCIFSFLPLLIFAAFALSTVAFALGAALVFALFWIGVALLLLVPALLGASAVAVLVWAWAVGSFVVARWLYHHVPPVGGRGDAEVEAEAGGKRVAVYNEGKTVEGEIGHVR